MSSESHTSRKMLTNCTELRASRSNVHFSFNHLTDFTVSNCSLLKRQIGRAEEPFQPSSLDKLPCLRLEICNIRQRSALVLHLTSSSDPCFQIEKHPN